MKRTSPTFPTFLGGLIVILAVAELAFGSIVIWFTLALILLFLSFIFGWYIAVAPVMKKPGTHLYYDGKHIIVESMLRLQTGLRDSDNELVKTGEIYIMNIDGNLDKLTSTSIKKIMTRVM
jgi:hypothetical protein